MGGHIGAMDSEGATNVRFKRTRGSLKTGIWVFAVNGLHATARRY